jgi:hypothetical protein
MDGIARLQERRHLNEVGPGARYIHVFRNGCVGDGGGVKYDMSPLRFATERLDRRGKASSSGAVSEVITIPNTISALLKRVHAYTGTSISVSSLWVDTILPA